MNKSIIGVLVVALAAFVLWRTFAAGYEKADTAWRLKWSQRDSADAAARAAVEAERECTTTGNRKGSAAGRPAPTERSR